jgi:hypothetical protein
MSDGRNNHSYDNPKCYSNGTNTMKVKEELRNIEKDIERNHPYDNPKCYSNDDCTCNRSEHTHSITNISSTIMKVKAELLNIKKDIERGVIDKDIESKIRTRKQLLLVISQEYEREMKSANYLADSLIEKYELSKVMNDENKIIIQGRKDRKRINNIFDDCIFGNSPIADDCIFGNSPIAEILKICKMDKAKKITIENKIAEQIEECAIAIENIMDQIANISNMENKVYRNILISAYTNEISEYKKEISKYQDNANLISNKRISMD